MKRNALFRIVLWGTVLLVLLAILFILFFAPRSDRRLRDETPAETMVSLARPKVESMDYASGNAITKSNVNVRSAPDMGAEVVAFAEEGTILNILRAETIGSNQWGYIGAPTKGWIAMAYVQMLEPLVEETMAAATEAPFPIAEEEGQCSALVTADALNVRTMPSSESTVAGTLHKDDSLLISRQELVDGITWGYTPAPVNGWVMMEYVELLEPTDVEITAMETTASPESEATGYGVSLDAANIRNMEIEWAAGSILIQPEDIPQIYIREETTAEEYEQMVWNVRDGKVSIQYSENTDHSFGMGLLTGKQSKDLIIQVPLDWQCDSLEMDAASASLTVKELTIREMEFDGASGTCIFENCTVENLDLDTASGDVQFNGSLQQLECDSASANIILELTSVPRSIDLDTASGNLDVTLPEDAGFTVTMDALDSDFVSDFDTTQRNGSYVAGSGRCRIDVDAMSGDVTVRKGTA